MTITMRPPARFQSASTTDKIANLVPGSGGSVLQLSMRRIHDWVAFWLPFEFEDVVADVAGAARRGPENFEVVEFARRVYKLTRFASGSQRLARAMVSWLNGPQLTRLMVPWPNASRLTRDYDLFFPVFNHPFELFALFAVADWRKHCRRGAGFVREVLALHIPNYRLHVA